MLEYFGLDLVPYLYCRVPHSSIQEFGRNFKSSKSWCNRTNDNDSQMMTMFGTKGLITTLGRTWIQQYPADISRDGAAQIDPPASNGQGGDGQAGRNVVERIGAHKSGTVKGIHGVNAPGPFLWGNH